MLKKKFVLDAHYPRVPDDVMAEMSQMWKDWDTLGNDFCYVEMDEELAHDYPVIKAHLDKLFEEMGQPFEPVLIHYWW